MNEVVTDILTEQPIVIPKVLLKCYTKLSDEDLLNKFKLKV